MLCCCLAHGDHVPWLVALEGCGLLCSDSETHSGCEAKLYKFVGAFGVRITGCLSLPFACWTLLHYLRVLCEVCLHWHKWQRAALPVPEHAGAGGRSVLQFTFVGCGAFPEREPAEGAQQPLRSLLSLLLHRFHTGKNPISENLSVAVCCPSTGLRQRGGWGFFPSTPSVKPNLNFRW